MGRRAGGVAIDVLGPLRVVVGGTPVSIPGALRRALLVRLAIVPNEVVPIDRLVEDLWRDAPPDHPVENLRSSISHLRARLEPDPADRGTILVSRRPGYLLAIDPDAIDAVRFARLAARGHDALTGPRPERAADLLRRALDLWRGPALAEFADQPWAQSEAIRLEELRLAGVEDHADAVLRLGGHAGLVGELGPLVADHPLRERLRALLMLALFRSGRQAEALRHYQDHRAAMVEELGLEPGDELRTLEAAILRDDPVLRATGVARQLPDGEVSFLLTDVAGSTRLWERAPDAMAPALARHDQLVDAVVGHNGGVLLKSRGEGDSTFSVFDEAASAATAAVELQHALIAEPWPPDAPLRVRMAVHTGRAELREGDYYGATVNRVARLRAAGHGGQVLISAASAALVHDRLPDRVSLKDLGVHRLKDLVEPEHVFQIEHPGLPDRFPPLATLDARLSLPVPYTTFVGRECELARVEESLDRSRLVSLVGAGGCGKTRLSLRVAERLAPSVDGAWLVELGPISGNAAVARAVAAAVGVGQRAADDVLPEVLAEHLHGIDALLLVDNCEHVLDEVAVLTDSLLRRCPRLVVLATSRERLGIPGEAVVAVDPLPLPDARQLFVDRAADVASDIERDEHRDAVDEICRRLDGIPLALELAAARAADQRPEEIAAHLDDRFALLTAGNRAALPRHQTLLAAVAWSYDLLSEPSRRLLRCLATFAGRFSDDDAVAVVGDDALVAGVDVLVAKSLVRREDVDGRTTFRLLETIRQFGADAQEPDERDGLRRRHADWVGALAATAEQSLRGSEQVGAIAAVSEQLDDVRVALDWMVLDDHDVSAGLAAAAALARFWSATGFSWDGRRWLETGLAADAPVPSETVARASTVLGGLLAAHGEVATARQVLEAAVASATEAAAPPLAAAAHAALAHVGLYESDFAAVRRDAEVAVELGTAHGEPWAAAQAQVVAGNACRFQGDYDAGVARLEAAVDIARRVGDLRTECIALAAIGGARLAQGRLEDADANAAASLDLARRLGDGPGLATALGTRATIAMVDGRSDIAVPMFAESAELARTVGDRRVEFVSVSNLAEAHRRLGDLAQTERWLSDALRICRATGEPKALAKTLMSVAELTLIRGDVERASVLAHEAIGIYVDIGDQRGLAEAFEQAATLAAARRRPVDAARLLGAGVAQRTRLGIPQEDDHQRLLDELLAPAVGAIGDEAFGAAQQEGAALETEEAIALAADVTAAASSSP